MLKSCDPLNTECIAFELMGTFVLLLKACALPLCMLVYNHAFKILAVQVDLRQVWSPE